MAFIYLENWTEVFKTAQMKSKQNRLDFGMEFICMENDFLKYFIFNCGLRRSVVLITGFIYVETWMQKQKNVEICD